MKLKIFLFTLFTLFIFSCQPRVKPPKVSKAPKINVLLAEFSNIDSILFDGKYLLQLEEARYQLGQRQKNFYLSPSKTGFKFYNTNRLFSFNQKDVAYLMPVDTRKARFKFRNKWYKGKIIFRLSDQQSILLINQIDLEEYLKAVLVGEMPSNKDAYLEALKAQAICARTYALSRMEQNKDKPFHVYADVRDQVYASLERRTSLADRAVEATRGVALMFNGQLAKVYYHSTCGGILEDISNYWSGKRVSYLTSRKDIIGDKFTCAPSPHFRWQKTFSFQQIDSLFAARFGKSFFTSNSSDTLDLFCKLKVLERTSSGRVKALEIEYADTSVVLNNFSIRKFFTDRVGKSLPSLLFKLSLQNDSTLVITGGGYGHGIGLCQWGALNMSTMGFRYYDILVNQYFPGTYLKEMY